MIPLLPGSFWRVSPPPGELRLVLKARTKQARADLVGAIRAAKGNIRATPFLSPIEKTNKSQVYWFAQNHRRIVVDSGDRVYIRPKGAAPSTKPAFILLSSPAEEVMQSLEAAEKLMARANTPAPRRTTTSRRHTTPAPRRTSYADATRSRKSSRRTPPRQPPRRMTPPAPRTPPNRY